MARIANLKKEDIVKASLAYAEKTSVREINISQIGAGMNVNPSLISYHYKAAQLRREVVKAAAVLKKWDIVAQGLADDTLPDDIDKEAIRKALKYLARKHRIRKLH